MNKLRQCWLSRYLYYCFLKVTDRPRREWCGLEKLAHDARLQHRAGLTIPFLCDRVTTGSTDYDR